MLIKTREPDKGTNFMPKLLAYGLSLVAANFCCAGTRATASNQSKLATKEKSQRRWTRAAASNQTKLATKEKSQRRWILGCVFKRRLIHPLLAA